MPILSSAVQEHETVVALTRDNSQPSAHKMLLQRRMHEAQWLKQLSAFVSAMEQLLLLLVMTLKLQQRASSLKKMVAEGANESGKLVDRLTTNMATMDGAVKGLAEALADLEQKRSEVTADMSCQSDGVKSKLTEIQDIKQSLVAEKKQLLKRLEEIDTKLSFFDAEEQVLRNQQAQSGLQQQLLRQKFEVQISEDRQKLLAKTDEKIEQCTLLALVQEAREFVNTGRAADVKALERRVDVKKRQLFRSCVDFLNFAGTDMRTAAEEIETVREKSSKASPDAFSSTASRSSAKQLVEEAVQKTLNQFGALLSSVGLLEGEESGASSGDTDEPSSAQENKNNPPIKEKKGKSRSSPAFPNNKECASPGGPSSAMKKSSSARGVTAILAWAGDSSVSEEEENEEEEASALDHQKEMENREKTPVLDPEVHRPLLNFQYSTGNQLQSIFEMIQAIECGGDEHLGAACADCGRADSSVTWASVTHGIYLCLQCAGLHRGLGVSRSFVRSITMDRWSFRELMRMLVAAKYNSTLLAVGGAAEKTWLKFGRTYSYSRESSEELPSHSLKGQQLLAYRYASQYGEFHKKLLDWHENAEISAELQKQQQEKNKTSSSTSTAAPTALTNETQQNDDEDRSVEADQTKPIEREVVDALTSLHAWKQRTSSRTSSSNSVTILATPTQVEQMYKELLGLLSSSDGKPGGAGPLSKARNSDIDRDEVVGAKTNNAENKSPKKMGCWNAASGETSDQNLTWNDVQKSLRNFSLGSS
ncbi:unnamed protein product [Amoebophrya sp. A25]|nr:unnamed protein product [Amoebophrya sp. A25]|eukprot:GSA25T00002739001.1